MRKEKLMIAVAITLSAVALIVLTFTVGAPTAAQDIATEEMSVMDYTREECDIIMGKDVPLENCNQTLKADPGYRSIEYSDLLHNIEKGIMSVLTTKEGGDRSPNSCSISGVYVNCELSSADNLLYIGTDSPTTPTYIRICGGNSDTDMGVLNYTESSYDWVTVAAEAGADTVYVLASNQTCYGTATTVYAWPSSFSTRLYFQGGSGDDTVYGTPNNDDLRGGDNTDYLHGGNGYDYLYGEDGVDVLYLDGGNVPQHGYGGDGGDYIYYTAYPVVITGYHYGYGQDGYDFYVADTTGGTYMYDPDSSYSTGNFFLGGPSTDYMWGDNGGDKMAGMGGDDYMYSGNGNDCVIGDHYNQDFLSGDEGDDLINAGFGTDQVYCDNVEWSGTACISARTGSINAGDDETWYCGGEVSYSCNDAAYGHCEDNN